MFKRKQTILILSLLIGTLAVGGTAYGVTSHYKYQNSLETAITELTLLAQELNEMKSELLKMEDENGYFVEEFAMDDLKPFKNQLTPLKDAHTHFHVKKDDLKNELEAIRLKEEELLSEIARLERKLEAQDFVNSLFRSDVLVGDKVKQDVPIIDDLKRSVINDLTLSRFKEDTKWYETIKTLLNIASDQAKQIERLGKDIDSFFKDGIVRSDVKESDFNKARKDVDGVKNPKARTELNSKLDKVSEVIEKRKAEQAKSEETTKSSGSKTTSGGKTTNSGKATKGNTGKTVKPKSAPKGESEISGNVRLEKWGYRESIYGGPEGSAGTWGYGVLEGIGIDSDGNVIKID